MVEFTADQLSTPQGFIPKTQYQKLLKKVKDQNKQLAMLKLEGKIALREEFKAAKVGRKHKYTPRKLQNRIIDYFATIQAKGKPPTISGLMNHLHMHRDQFYTYSTYPEYKDIMEKTRNMMENWYEESLIIGKGNPQGIQFALKNRFGWTDTQIVRHEESGEENLVRKIEALAPELVQFFVTNKIEHTPVIEAEVTDVEA